MAHNIARAEQIRDITPIVDDPRKMEFSKGDKRTPGSYDPWSCPILTVTDGDHSNANVVHFYFRQGSVHDAAIVVNPWSPLKVTISGEDLFAFRELLNELPERAFRRPADPVEKPAWVEGDKVVNIEETGHAWLYVRNGHGTWKAIGFGRGKDGRPSRDGVTVVTDADIDRYLTSPDHDGFNVLRRGGEEL